MTQPRRPLTFFPNRTHSGNIRGVQIADYLGAKINPTEGYDHDTCIFVKRVSYSTTWPEYSYVDVVDGGGVARAVKDLPHIGVITFTTTSQRLIADYLQREVLYIPQHHCNYGREVREDGREVKVVGFVGGAESFNHSFEDMSKKLECVGLEFRPFLLKWKRWVPRQHIVDFYKCIDIQVVYRLNSSRRIMRFKDSLKLVNAGSFRIPTVAIPEHNDNLHFPGCVVAAYTIDEMVEQCRRLKEDGGLYRGVVDTIHPLTEAHHISNIAPLYYGLE